MKKTQQRKTEGLSLLLAAASTAVVFLFFYYLVSHTPMVLDDYNYTFHWGASGFNRSLGDITDSLVYHYFHTNGRIVLHFFVFLFCMLDKIWFNLCAALCFCALGWLVYYHSYGSLCSIRPHRLVLIYLAFFLLTPSFADSYLWIAGSCNYLFSSVLVLIYLIPWREAMLTPPARCPWMAPLMLLGGVIAGWTNENLCLAVLTMQAGFLIVYCLRKTPIRLWMLAGMLGTAVGAGLMLLAPGNMVRAGGSLGGIGAMVARIIPMTIGMVRNFWELMLVCFILLVLLGMQEKWNLKILLSKLKLSLVYLFGAGISVYAMCAVEEAPDRVWSIMLCLCLVTSCTVHAQLHPDSPQRLAAGRAFMLALLMTAHLPAALQAVNSGWQQNEARLAFIQEQLAQGHTDLIVPDIRVNSPFSVFRYETLSEDGESWENISFAHRIGLHSIQIGEDFGILP